MDRTIRKPRSLSFPPLGRRSFFRIGAAAGAAAYAALMHGCGMSEKSRSFIAKREREYAASVCTLCPSYCAIRAYSEAGKIVAIAGDPDDPNTGGKLCPIGLSMLNLHYSPDRLTSAYRKMPDGKIAAAKPEEIIAHIAGLIRGGKSLNIYGRITPYTSQLSKTLHAVCSREPQSANVIDLPAFLNTDGRPPVFDFINARIAFLFDANILEHGYPYIGYVRRIAEARLRGLRLVTFSPFLTNTATAGDWIPLRSLDAVFLAPVALARQALNDPSLHISPPHREIADALRSLGSTFIENGLGLSGEAIRDLTRRFFNEPGPAISSFRDPAVQLLNNMKGNLNRPGGLIHPGKPALGADAEPGHITELLRNRRNVVFLHQSNRVFNLASIIRPILLSPERATVVCVDSFMSETAALSDFILPLASPLETLTLAEPLPLGKPFLAAAPPVVKPQPSCRSFDDWFVDLAAAVNGSIPQSPALFAAEMIPGNSFMHLTKDRAIYPIASDPKPLKEEGDFFTDLGLFIRIHDMPKPEAIAVQLQPDQFFLAAYEESIQNSASAPSKWINEISYSPKVYVHPQRAERLGIRNGDRIVLTGSKGGSAEGIALLFEGVHPEAIAIPWHHGHTGYGRVARGEAFTDPNDPDMARIFWGKNRGVNPGDFTGGIIAIRKKQG